MQTEQPQGQALTSIHLVANAGSGQGAAQKVAQRMEAECERRGVPFRRYLAPRPAQLPDKIKAAIDEAKACGGRVVAVGGDGTVRAVAQALGGSETALAVIPTGTFNFFARNLNIPLELDDAISLALEGNKRAVSLGRVNGHTFVINASFGLYARLIRAREQHTRRFGRHRLVASLSTLFTLLRGYRAMKLQLTDEHQNRSIKSPMVFVGINALQLRGVDLEVESCVSKRQLGVVVMSEVNRWALFRLTLRGLVRRLRDEQSLELYCADYLSIRPDRRKVSVVLDGERIRMRGPLEFTIDEDALIVVVPRTEEGS